MTWIHSLRRLLCRSRSEEGQSLVEFSLSFLMFAVLMFAIFDFGHFFWIEMCVQSAIQEAARYGSTGNHLTVKNPNGTTTTLARLTSILDTLQSDALGVQFSSVTISSSTASGPTGVSWTWTPGSSTTPPTSVLGAAGGQGYFVTVSATTNIQLFTPLLAQMFPNGGYAYTTSVTVMNEPFGTAATAAD